MDRFIESFESYGLGSYSLEKHLLVAFLLVIGMSLLLVAINYATGGNKSTAWQAIRLQILGLVLIPPFLTAPAGLYFIYKAFQTAMCGSQEKA